MSVCCDYYLTPNFPLMQIHLVNTQLLALFCGVTEHVLQNMSNISCINVFCGFI